MPMTKVRVFMIFLTILVVGILGLFASYYARGYRFNIKTFEFTPNGILVIKSEPDGASVYINGELKTATNATISLPPGSYDIEVKKDGFMTWSKRIQIEKEIVTQATVSMFKNAPSLSPVTFSGASNPVSSKDGTKIAYSDKEGLYTTETYNLPIGFSNSPTKITDGDMTNAQYSFSPNGRQILLNMSNSIFVVDSGSFTAQNDRVNVVSKKEEILSTWESQEKAKDRSLFANLPSVITDILTVEGVKYLTSPDDTMILYTPAEDANIPNYLIPQLPGSSTQKQSRDIKVGKTYVYDIKEDRNFLISEDSFESAVFYWMPDSRHILNPTEGKIVIMDYDGTNKQVVYSGSYIAPYAFPYRNTTKLLILTNLGSSSQTPNLYELTIK